MRAFDKNAGINIGFCRMLRRVPSLTNGGRSIIMNAPTSDWGIARRRSSLRPRRTGQKCKDQFSQNFAKPVAEFLGESLCNQKLTLDVDRFMGGES